MSGPCPQCGSFVVSDQVWNSNGAYRSRCLAPLDRECYFQAPVGEKPYPGSASDKDREPDEFSGIAERAAASFRSVSDNPKDQT